MSEALNDAQRGLLGGVGWLAMCSPEFRDAFLGIGRVKELETGAELYGDGAIATHVYGLIDGQINVHLTAPTNEELVYPFAAPGRWYGLADVVAEIPAHGTAVAGVPSLTCRIARDDLMRFLRDDPSRYQAIIRHEFALRRHIQETVVDLATSDGLERISRRLLSLMEFEGADPSAGLTISQLDFAAASGVSVPTLQRSFRKLRRSGVIETAYGKVVVKDLTRLREFALPVPD